MCLLKYMYITYICICYTYLCIIYRIYMCIYWYIDVDADRGHMYIVAIENIKKKEKGQNYM